jgi:transcriptional regulator with XRE-family HTH domain
MEDSIVERVIILMEKYELTASAFADKIDVQRSSMSHLVSGRNKPSLDFIQKVLNNFSDINPTWLIMGTGPMKQLDLFDNKGEIAPIEPLPTQKFDNSTPPPPIVPQVAKKPAFQATAVEAPVAAVPINIKTDPVQAPQTTPQPEPIVTNNQIDTNTVKKTLIPPTPSKTEPTATNSNESAEISDQNDKKVVKIVFFYSDKTFETFNPQ